jgi:periplasmic protein TonB
MSHKDKRSAPSSSAGPHRAALSGELRFSLPEEPTSLKTVFGSAGLTHSAFILLLILAVWMRPDRQIQAMLPDVLPADLVFIETPGPGGGGGGGGNQRKEPPKTEKLPAAKPPEAAPVIPKPEPEPTPEPETIKPEAPIITATEAPAVISSAPTLSASASLGTGKDDGAGTGSGGGIGPGKGTGIGDGQDKGIGGGVYQAGNGVSSPTLLHKEKPQYTPEGMIRRIQGEVHLHCIVLTSGAVGSCDIVKPLDANQYGMDNQAIKAAKQFRFRPGVREGQPVNVMVRIELEFNMR